MNELYQNSHPEVESFDERLDIFFREIELAIKWQRPSILLAIYPSEVIHAEVEAALESKIISFGQEVAHVCSADGGDPDISLFISQFPEPDKVIFFVDGLNCGNEEHRSNRYRALNVSREYFVEKQIRIVFWLTESEAVSLAHDAPDFWASRHRVIDFIASQKPDETCVRVLESAWQGQGEDKHMTNNLVDTHAKISLRETTQAGLPEWDGSTTAGVNLLLTLGIMHWRKGDSEKADESLRAALEIAIKTQDKRLEAVCFNAIALVKTDQGLFDEAVEAYEQAIEMAPEKTFIWGHLGNLYTRLGQYPDAVEAYLNTLENNPVDSVVWNSLGNAYVKVGQIDEAIDAYRKALELNDRYVDPWMSLGSLFKRQNLSLDATKAYQKVTEIDAHNGPAWNELGHMYFELEAFDEAIEAFSVAMKLGVQTGWSCFKLAFAYAHKHEFASAVPFYLRCVELFENSEDRARAWNQLGDVYREARDYDNAILAYQRADKLVETGNSQVVGQNIVDEIAAALPDQAQEAIPAQAEAHPQDELAATSAPEQPPAQPELVVSETIQIEVTQVIVVEAPAVSEQTEPPVSDVTVPPVDDTQSGDIPVTETDVPQETTLAPSLGEALLQAVEEAKEEAQELLEGAHEVVEKIQLVAEAVVEQAEEVASEAVAEAQAITEAVTEKAEEVTIEVVADAQFVAEAVVAEAQEVVAEAVAEAQVVAEAVQETTAKAMEEVELVADKVQEVAAEAVAEAQVVAEAVAEETQEVVAEAVAEAQVVAQAVTEKAQEVAAEAVAEAQVVAEAVAEETQEVVTEAVAEAQVVAESVAEKATEAVEETQILAHAAAEKVQEVATEAAAELQTVAQEIATGAEALASAAVETLAEDAETTPDSAEIDLHNAHIWNELGNIYFKVSAFDEALDAYNKAIELGLELGLLYSNLGFACAYKGKYIEAIPLYQKGIDLIDNAPAKAQAWGRLGDAYGRMNEFASALAAYQTALELDPANVAFKDGLDEIRARLARLDTVTEEASELAAPLDETPAPVDAAAVETDDTDNADLLPAQQDDENDEMIVADLVAQIFDEQIVVETALPEDVPASTDVVTEASVHVEQVVQTVDGQTTIQTQVSLAVEEVVVAETELAVEAPVLETIAPMDPEPAADEPAQAEEPVAAREIDLKNAHIWNELGHIFARAGSLDDALDAYNKAIELDPTFAWPYSNLALVHVQKGQYGEAIPLYQKSVELFDSFKDKAVSWNRLGDAFRQLNEYDNAIAAYQIADELNQHDCENGVQDASRAVSLSQAAPIFSYINGGPNDRV